LRRLKVGKVVGLLERERERERERK